MASTTNPTGLLTPPSTSSLLDEKLAQTSGSNAGKRGSIVGGAILLGGLIYIGTRLASDLSIVHSASVFPYILLGIALMIALGFEFVNGFHDPQLRRRGHDGRQSQRPAALHHARCRAGGELQAAVIGGHRARDAGAEGRGSR